MIYPFLHTPCAIVDLDIAERNIRAMAEGAAHCGIRHRPHIKTHKSVYFAKKQLEAGAAGITCAKLAEAERMAAAGFDDIFVAYPLVGRDKLERFDALDGRIGISCAINSLAGARGLSDFARERGKRYRVFIEVDGRMGRGGLPPFEPTAEFAAEARKLPGIAIAGLMYFGGDVYGLRGEDEIRRRIILEADDLARTKELVERAGVPVEWVSAGSSFSSKSPELLSGIDEIRAGTYVFNDCSQLSIGRIGVGDCALRILSTVVAKPDACHAIIDAGSKTLTSDLVPFRRGHGWIVGHEGAIIDHLSEEHGFVSSDAPIELEIGDRIEIIPNHACVAVNLCDALRGVRGGRLEADIPVEARGLNY